VYVNVVHIPYRYEVNAVNMACYSRTMSRTTYHHGNLRQALVDGAFDLVRTQGHEAVTLRELARNLEVSAAAIYRHFPDRDALLAEVGRRSREELTSRMLSRVKRVRASDRRARAVGRFLAIGRAYLAFARDEPKLLAAAFLPVDAPYERPEVSPWSVLSQALDDLSREGAMPRERRVGAEVLAWSAVHGFAMLRETGAFRTSGEPEPDVETLLLGIARALGLEVSPAPS
jgi:AcrR family transcriptional regulator